MKVVVGWELEGWGKAIEDKVGGAEWNYGREKRVNHFIFSL